MRHAEDRIRTAGQRLMLVQTSGTDQYAGKISERSRVAVVGNDGTLVAFAVTTTTCGLGNGLVDELEDLYVRPEARRRGRAEALVDDNAPVGSRAGLPSTPSPASALGRLTLSSTT
jgi:GNAT superfamily N-acetyltransferase